MTIRQRAIVIVVTLPVLGVVGLWLVSHTNYGLIPLGLALALGGAMQWIQCWRCQAPVFARQMGAMRVWVYAFPGRTCRNCGARLNTKQRGAVDESG